MNKFCLGTAQLGFDYGINNKTGKPSLSDSINILKYLYDSGVRIIDTAKAYGISEEIIGKYHKQNPDNKFRVITKLTPNSIKNSTDINEEVNFQIRQSLETLDVNILDGVLLHTPEDFYNDDVLDALINAKKNRLTKNIGVSVYETKHAIDVVSSPVIDYIQIMYSVFDQRLDKTTFWKLAKNNDIKVFCRSVYLQGLIFMDLEDVPSYLEHAKAELQLLKTICNQYNKSINEVAYYFSRSKKEIDFLVIGCENKFQLEQNLKLESDFVESKQFDLIVNDIKANFSDTDKSIIFPSLWKNT